MLAYRLVAHGIGGRTVRELNAGPGAHDEGMDVDELLTWAAYYSLEPPPETRADVHTAMLMAQQYNMNRKQGTAARRPVDFMVQWYKEPSRGQSPGSMKQIMMRHILALGGELEEPAS